MPSTCSKPGRPVTLTLTKAQENSIVRRLNSGDGSKAILRDTGYEFNAIMRVRRNWVNGAYGKAPTPTQLKKVRATRIAASLKG